MSTPTWAELAKHDDDMLLLTILAETGAAVAQVGSILKALYDIYKKAYPVYAGVGLLFYVALPLIFVVEDKQNGMLEGQSTFMAYVERLTGYAAIKCCHNAW